MITVTLPMNAHIEGEICTLDDDHMLLRDGMLHVDLCSGFYIDVSWEPEHDPDGEYVVTVYKDNWENRPAQETTRDPFRAAEFVRHFAEQYWSRLKEVDW